MRSIPGDLRELPVQREREGWSQERGEEAGTPEPSDTGALEGAALIVGVQWGAASSSRVSVQDNRPTR